jgi:hypothetical protein
MNTPKALPAGAPAPQVVDPSLCTFEQRDANKLFNLFFSYGGKEDLRAAELGYQFLGAACDEKGNEVHVFQKKTLAEHQHDS